jgi:leucyl-tRNA synthetase
MEFLQGISDKRVSDRECIVVLLKLLAPFAPFTAHELWERIGGERMLCEQSWPEYDESLVARKEIEFVLQVNGKIRDKATLPADTPQSEVEQIALRSVRVRSYLKNRRVIKMVFVPNRLLNIVAN